MTGAAAATVAAPTEQVMDITMATKHTANPQLPVWTRVWLAAIAQADESGVSRWHPGELREVIDPSGLTTSRNVWRGVQQCIVRGLLASGSGAYKLVLVDRARA